LPFRNVVAAGPASDGFRGSRIVVEQEGRRRRRRCVVVFGVRSHVVVDFDCASVVAPRFLVGSPLCVLSSGCDAACIDRTCLCSSPEQ